MGSMYMSNTLLTDELLSTGYRKFWHVDFGVTDSDIADKCQQIKEQEGKKRAQSCGPAGRERRKAEFRDSSMILVSARRNGVTSARTERTKVTNYAVDSSHTKRAVSARTERTKTFDNTHDGQTSNGVNFDGGGKNINNNNSGFARLNMKTLQNIGWVSGANDEMKNNEDDQKANLNEDDDYYKMTKAEFRKLQEQVRDVSMNLKNKFRTSAYQEPVLDKRKVKKLYQRPNGETTNQVYRTQLAASLKAFQQKQWPPLNHQELDPTFMRCKPVQQPFQHALERPMTSCNIRGGPPRLQRPKSVPASALRSTSGHPRKGDTPYEIRPGKFDTLSPNVLSELIGNTETLSPDVEESVPEYKSPLVDVLAEEAKQLLDNDDNSTTSGIDSGASENESPSEDEDSEFEPEIDPNIDIPQLNLRPEKQDEKYIPEPKRGWRQYDFDMSNIEQPPYQFKNPFPDYLDDIDLKQMAKLKWNWRNHLKVKTGAREPDLDGVVDRLVEFEKLQSDTIDWEIKRSVQMKKVLIKRNSSAKVRDKRCESSCLQATCFGDCPEKLVQSNSCENCRQSYCTGNCKDLKYEQRMRQGRIEDERPLTPKQPFPRACSSCQKRHNAKFINANNLVLGNQRLNNATFTRGQSSLKAKDLRPKTPTNYPVDVLKEFEKMNIETVQPQRPSTSMSLTSRPRSRNAMYPGKSFGSQRKNSLTDLDKIVPPSSSYTTRRKKTKGTAKTKRPKTAA